MRYKVTLIIEGNNLHPKYNSFDDCEKLSQRIDEGLQEYLYIPVDSIKVEIASDELSQ